MEVGVVSVAGPHHSNEDRLVLQAFPRPDGTTYLYAVADGHGGPQAADFLHMHLPSLVAHSMDTSGPQQEDAAFMNALFRQCDRSFHDIAIDHDWTSVGACLACVIIKDSHIVIGSAGDCGVIVFDRKGNFERLTPVHAANIAEEKERLEAAGAEVRDGRIFGILEPSRGIGDIDIRFRCEGSVIPDPYIVTKNLKDDLFKYDFMLLASDGVLDAMSPEDIVSYILVRSMKQQTKKVKSRKKGIRKSSSPESNAAPHLQQILEDLAAFCLNRTEDDVSAILLDLNKK